MAFWRSKTKSPPELVKALRDSIGKLDGGYAGSETRRRVSEIRLDCVVLPDDPVDASLLAAHSSESLYLGEG